MCDAILFWPNYSHPDAFRFARLRHKKNSKVGSLLPFAALAQTLPKTTVFERVLIIPTAQPLCAVRRLFCLASQSRLP
jgi:hypothetical protein